MVVVEEENVEKKLVNGAIDPFPIYKRAIVDYKDYSSNFKENKTDFSKQFAHMYACRLGEMRDILIERSLKKWGNVTIVKLTDLEHQEDNRCVIIGTLYKHQQWKPSILRELSEETTELIHEPKDDYCDSGDVAYLEDEMLRIKLVGKLLILDEIVTGVVCAILGHKTELGTFDMEDWCFAGCPLQSNTYNRKTAGKIVFVSSLDMSNETNDLAVSLLNEWLCGMAGNLTVQSQQSSIVRLVLTGNSVSSTSAIQGDKDYILNAVDNSETVEQTTEAMGKLDCWLENVLGSCCVTLMPGEHDPTNYMLPQKPIQRFLLRKSFSFGNLKGASNPWIGKIGERYIVGSSGQPIEDIFRVSGTKNRVKMIDWLERTLSWRHICPTAPDTLPSHPYYEKDLFIMKKCPDIYFVGNADEFATKLYRGENGQKVRLICVPKFSTTQSVVLVDLETLEAEIVTFGTS